MKLSTGQESTLGVYLALSEVVFGEDSKACKYLRDKIAESPRGKDEPVLAHETQMIQALAHIHGQK